MKMTDRQLSSERQYAEMYRHVLGLEDRPAELKEEWMHDLVNLFLLKGQMAVIKYNLEALVPLVDWRLTMTDDQIKERVKDVEMRICFRTWMRQVNYGVVYSRVKKGDYSHFTAGNLVRVLARYLYDALPIDKYIHFHKSRLAGESLEMDQAILAQTVKRVYREPGTEWQYLDGIIRTYNMWAVPDFLWPYNFGATLLLLQRHYVAQTIPINLELPPDGEIFLE